MFYHDDDDRIHLLYSGIYFGILTLLQLMKLMLLFFIIHFTDFVFTVKGNNQYNAIL